jgi:hypothetical protein
VSLGILSYLTLGLQINNKESYSQYTSLVTSEDGIVQLWPLQGYQQPKKFTFLEQLAINKNLFPHSCDVAYQPFDSRPLFFQLDQVFVGVEWDC